MGDPWELRFYNLITVKAGKKIVGKNITIDAQGAPPPTPRSLHRGDVGADRFSVV